MYFSFIGGELIGCTDGVLLFTLAVVLRELTGILHTYQWAGRGTSRDLGSPIPRGSFHRRCIFLSLALKTSRWGLRVLSELLEEQTKVQSQALNSCLAQPPPLFSPTIDLLRGRRNEAFVSIAVLRSCLRQCASRASALPHPADARGACSAQDPEGIAWCPFPGAALRPRCLLSQVMQVVREQITRALPSKPNSLDQFKSKLRSLSYSEILRLRQSERMSQDDFQSPPIV